MPSALATVVGYRKCTIGFAITPGSASGSQVHPKTRTARSHAGGQVPAGAAEVRRFQISLRSRCTAMLAGLRTLIQARHGPDR
jgi:hypothetical protein